MAFFGRPENPAITIKGLNSPNLCMFTKTTRGSLASEGSGANQSVSASESTSTMNWTVGKVFLSIFLFIVAALLEVGGGWLVWQTGMKEGQTTPPGMLLLVILIK